MATEIAKAYVQVVPTTRGISNSLSQEMSGAGESSGSSFSSKFASVAKKLIAVAGIGKVISSAVSAGADYEQAVGGIQTLFKDSAGTMLKYAQDAFKTCGMSANQYMEQATSFAASLVQSCGGDTAKAAEAANMAMGDMSDNVNKMGSSMESVQYAYQGFARGNFTMLDNLKLGYSGTKAEMERLLTDAEALKAKQGEVADYSIDSYSDIVEAIHVVQDEMGITGTTAQEAGTTISGSLAMVKASWENVLTSLASGENLKESMQGLFTSILGDGTETNKGLVSLLSNMVGTILQSIPDFLDAGMQVIGQFLQGISSKALELPSKAGELVNTIRQTILKNAPELISGGLQLVENLILGIIKAIPQMAASALVLLNSFTSSILENLTMMNESGKSMLEEVIDGILSAMPTLVSVLPQFISTIISFIQESIPIILNAAMGIITAIVEALPEIATQIAVALPTMLESLSQGITTLIDLIVQLFPTFVQTIVAALPQIIGAITTFITSAAPSFIQAAVDIILALVEALPTLIGVLVEALPTIIQTITQALVLNLPQIITTIINTLIAAVPQLIQAGITLLMSLVQAIPSIVIALAESLPQIITAIITGLIDAIPQVIEAGKTLLGQIVALLPQWGEDIKKAVSDAFEAVKEKATEIWESIKEKLSEIWEGIKTKISEKVEEVRSKLSETWENIRAKVTEVWEGIKSKISEVWESIRSKISEKIESIKSKISTGFESAKRTVTNIFNDIKSKIQEKIEDARDKVHDAIEKIKSFFHFEWKLPDIKLPHFHITGEFSLNPPSIPHFSVDWYKKAMNNAMVLDGASIFGASNGNLLGGGEAGREVISGEDHLLGLINSSVDDAIGRRLDDVVNLLEQYLPGCASTKVALPVNSVDRALTANMARKANAW